MLCLYLYAYADTLPSIQPRMIYLDTEALTPRQAWILKALIDSAAIVPAAATLSAHTVHLSLAPSDLSLTFNAFLTDIRAHWHAAPGRIFISPESLNFAADLLSQHTESESPLLDRHGRVPSSASLLVRAGLEQQPVLSLLAAALREALVLAAESRPVRFIERWPEGCHFAAALTHDLDVVSFWPLFTGLRAVELFRKHEWSALAKTVQAAATNLFSDPVTKSIEQILALEVKYQAKSSWFLICSTPSLRTWAAGDATYRPESRRLRQIIALLRSHNHSLGLHGSQATLLGPSIFAEQRTRLSELIGAKPSGVRQHYLKWQPGQTAESMAQAGFRYDTTVGFADRNGFRTGLADLYPLWHPRTDQAIDLDEVPFCWMDRAQSKYQGIEKPDRWIEQALALAEAVQQVEGIWCGIWHPNLSAPLGFPGALSAYEQLVQSLSARGAWLASLDEIVAWRQARRSVLATAIKAGQIEVTGPSCSYPFRLYDPRSATAVYQTLP